MLLALKTDFCGQRRGLQFRYLGCWLSAGAVASLSKPLITLIATRTASVLLPAPSHSHPVPMAHLKFSGDFLFWVPYPKVHKGLGDVSGYHMTEVSSGECWTRWIRDLLRRTSQSLAHTTVGWGTQEECLTCSIFQTCFTTECIHFSTEDLALIQRCVVSFRSQQIKVPVLELPFLHL